MERTAEVLVRIVRLRFLTVATLMVVSGCTPSALTSARTKIHSGDYAGAHRELVALAEHPENLSPSERREVKDDLCATDFAIGRPVFPLKDQQRVCADAAVEPGSHSRDVLSQVYAATVQADDQQIEKGIKSGDLAAAETAVEDYESIPGANQVQVAKWANQMWKLVEQKEVRAERANKAAVTTAITSLQREHADTRKMNDREFLDWVVKTTTIDGAPMVSDPHLEKGHLKLALNGLAPAALNLDKFASINDAVIARCACDGRTDVGVGSNDLPAYVVRLDPEIGRSEVLILLSGEQIGPRISM